MELADFLAHAGDLSADEVAHFGVKGMHWGVHRRHAGVSDSKKAAYTDRANQHEHLAKAHAATASNALTEYREVGTKGFNSAAAKRVYGNHAATQGEWAFYGEHRQGKSQALSDLSNNLRLVHNQHVRAANHHAAKAAKFRAKAAG